MPARKRIKWRIGQLVLVGQGSGKKLAVAEILDAKRRTITGWRVNSHDVMYFVGYDGRKEGTWVEQSRIRRALPTPTQEQLESRARELYGNDYL